MPKTFPIMIEVEEIALGPVLRRLNDMPGIAKLHLQLGHGGEGAGKKQLEHHAAARSNNGNTEQTIIKLLLSGPKHIREIADAVGGGKSRAYGAMTQLRKKGLAEAGEGKAMHQLTAKTRAQLGGGAPALPVLPAPVKHGPKGRAVPGSGQIVLRAALDAGPVSPSDLRASLGVRGMSEKSIQGVLHRAKRDGIVKQNGAKLYELTAKGQKIELGGATNG
jgi:hypothetical protein